MEQTWPATTAFAKTFQVRYSQNQEKERMDKLHPKSQSLLFVRVIQDVIITLMEFSYFYLQILLCAHCNLI